MKKEELLVLNEGSLAKSLFDVLKANARVSNEKALDLVEKLVDEIIKPQNMTNIFLTAYARAVAGGVLAQEYKRGLKFVRGMDELIDMAGEYDDLVKTMFVAQIEAGVDMVYQENKDSFIKA